VDSLPQGVELAAEALASGQAAGVLARLIDLSRQAQAVP
jgi:hypothetical protein